MAARKRVDQRRGQTRVERVESRLTRPGDGRWWIDQECHDKLFGQLERLLRLNAARRKQDLYYACLYDDAEFATLMQGSRALGEFTPQTMTTNIVKRQVDAFVAKHTKNRPLPMAYPNGGTYGEQRRARALTSVFEGALEQVEFWQTRTLRRRDGAIWGSGFALNHRVGNKLFHDRAFPWEFLVDPREAMYGKPRTLLLLRWVDKLVLMERFPKFAEQIAQAENYEDRGGWSFGIDDTTDLVLVVHAWRLPSKDPTEKDSKGGSFAMCVSNATLMHAEYKRDYFPVSKWDFSPALVGWFGDGMAKQLDGLQYEVNAIGLRLQEQGYMTGTFVWTPPGVGFDSEMVNNGVFTHIESEKQPVFFNPSPWHPQFFDYYMRLRGEFAAQETRISEMAVRGDIPPGMESGRAIRAWNNLDDSAFVPQGHADEDDVIDTSWQLYDLIEEIHEEEKGGDTQFTVSTSRQQNGRVILEDADWGKVRMERDAFKLKVAPTSYVRGSPAEQMQSADDLAAKGLVSVDEIYAMLNVPDVQALLNKKTAPRRAIEKILQAILDADDPASAYMSPEPAMGLELCRALGLMTYLDAFTQDADEEHLRYVLNFAVEAELQLEEMNAPAAPNGPAEQPIDQAPGMDPALDPNSMPPGPDGLMAPPEGQLMPANATAPGALPPVPGM